MKKAIRSKQELLDENILLKQRVYELEQLETKRKQTELNLKESNQQLLDQTEELSRMATVVKDSNDSVLIQDLEGNITAWNYGAIKMYGYSEQEATKMNVADLVPKEYKTEALNFIVSIKKDELVESLETKRKTKDGKILDIWMVVTKLVDKDGNLIGVATTERDITERLKEKERETYIALLEAQKTELERFTYTVSHDLKSPIITIKGFMGFLEKDAVEGNIQRLHSDINRINAAVTKMGDLLDKLLDLSRIGRKTNEFVDVPLYKIAHEVAETLHGSLAKKGVRLEIQSGMPTIHGDYVSSSTKFFKIWSKTL